MFTYQVTAFKEAEKQVVLHINRKPPHVIAMGKKSIPVYDKTEAELCYRTLVVNIALINLGYPPAPQAGMLSQSAYSAFATIVESK